MNYTVSDILNTLPDVFVWASENLNRDRRFQRVSTDSRTARPGDLFVAIRGERFDGHDFVDAALNRGAVAAVVEEAWLRQRPERGGLPVLAVADTLPALKALAHFHRRHYDIPVLAITGTVGKTTAKEFVAAVLGRRFRVLRNEKSFNNAIGVSLTLLSLEGDHQIAVTEIGTNHPGEIYDLASVVEPTAGLLLNVGRGHLEFFGSIEGVLREKLDLARWLQEHDRGPVFVNADDPRLATQVSPNVPTVTFGQSPTADVRVTLEGVETGKAVVRFGGQRVRLSVPGVHHLTNAAAAVAVGLHFDVPEDAIAAALAETQPAAHRGQVENVAGVTLVDETYNCNPESARAALALLSNLPGGRRIAVLGDMLELGEAAETEHRSLGGDLRHYGVDALFAFGPLSARTAEAAAETGVKAWHFDDRMALAEALRAFLEPGDVVLFKGSRGMRMEKVLERIRNALGPSDS